MGPAARESGTGKHASWEGRIGGGELPHTQKKVWRKKGVVAAPVLPFLNAEETERLSLFVVGDPLKGKEGKLQFSFVCLR